MIPDAEIAAARAALPSLLPMRLKRAGKLLVGLCPFHDEKTPSFTVYPDWHFFCFGCCAKGDAISWVQRTKGLAFPDAVRQLIGRTALGNKVTPRYQTRAPRETEVPSLVLDLWRTATAPRIASMYLDTRGIPQKALPVALRGHERVWCQEAGEYRPAMIAAITDAAGRLTAIQRTYLETRLVYDGQTNHQKGARCPDLSAGKKCLGPLGTGAVRLSPAEDVLGLAESAEDALAAARLFRLPVWCVCGAHRLGNIELPKSVTNVVIFADNDPPGRAAAAKAEYIYHRKGYSTQVEYPERKDFAEMLL